MTLIDIDPLQTETSELSLTPAAAERVRRILQERNAPDHALRVFISGGGCSGQQYGMALEAEPQPTDTRLTFEGLHVVIDPLSLEYLRGATIDYVDDLMGGGFRIENPNAVSSCGCGHSFRTRDTSAGAATAGSGSCCS
jgi:iron-sulfur cluster assembly protein